MENRWLNKVNHKGKKKLAMVFIGLILFLAPIGFGVGLQDEDKTTVVLAILGSISGVGLVSFIVGLLWWFCVDHS